MIADALRLAKEATNGWACYARRDAEHREITRLHDAIKALEVLATVPGEGPEPIDNGNIFVFCDFVDQSEKACVRGAGHTGPHAVCVKPYPQVPVMLRAAAEGRAPEPLDDGLTAEGRMFDEGYKAGYAAAVEARAPHEPPAEPESWAIRQAINSALDGDPPSDFMQSFSIVRRVIDMLHYGERWKQSAEYTGRLIVEKEKQLAEAHASRPAPLLDWQPIATAPKDGTEILTFSRGLGLVFVRWGKASPEWHTPWQTTWDGQSLATEPSHWCIPDPPAAGPQADKA